METLRRDGNYYLNRMGFREYQVFYKKLEKTDVLEFEEANKRFEELTGKYKKNSDNLLIREITDEVMKYFNNMPGADELSMPTYGLIRVLVDQGMDNARRIEMGGIYIREDKVSGSKEEETPERIIRVLEGFYKKGTDVISLLDNGETLQSNSAFYYKGIL